MFYLLSVESIKKKRKDWSFIHDMKEVEEHRKMPIQYVEIEQMPIMRGESPDPIVWRQLDTFTLICAWKRHQSETHSTMKHMWRTIAAEITTERFKPSYEQCVSKWKGLQRTYRKITSKSNSSFGMFFEDF